MPEGRGLLLVTCALLAGCERSSRATEEGKPQPAAVGAPSAIAPAPPPPPPASFTLIAGGDVEVGRATGKIIQKNPKYDPFARIQPLLDSADVRFCNLESTIFDPWDHKTQADWNPLVFSGPPASADTLKRARWDVLSTANNHAWDNFDPALFSTIDELDRVGIAHSGTGKTREQAYAPVYTETHGMKIAWIAVTSVFNFGDLRTMDVRNVLALADPEELPKTIAEARAHGAEIVIVSHHGGREYGTLPESDQVAIDRAAIDAGADVVLGHHPHVLQGIEWRRGKPIFYSLGNLLMQRIAKTEWSGYSYLARLSFTRGEATPKIALCPFRVDYLTPVGIEDDGTRPQWEDAYWRYVKLVNDAAQKDGTKIGPLGPDGCAVAEPGAGAQ